MPKPLGTGLESASHFSSTSIKTEDDRDEHAHRDRSAADSLPVEQKEQLPLFLATRLRAAGATLPEPRQLSREEIVEWITEDEADMQQFDEQPRT